MRIGWLGSPLIHGLLIASLLIAWPQKSRVLAQDGAVVPIDVVNFTDISNVSAIAAPAPPAPVDQPTPEGTAQPTSPKPEEVEPIPDSSKPPPKQQTPQSVDLNKLQELIDRSKKTAGQKDKQTASNAARGPNPRKGAGLQNNLSANEMDYLRARLETCWHSNAASADPERLRVVVHIELKKGGALKSDPVVVYPASIADGDTQLRVAARNALNAVRTCAPFSAFKPERYAYWREFDLNMHSNGEVSQ